MIITVTELLGNKQIWEYKGKEGNYEGLMNSCKN